MFIHMFFVNVQSCSVLNACYLWIRYFVIQSRFLSTMPPFSCGYFLRDFHDFLHSHIRSCLSQHHTLTALHQPPAEMLQPGRCPSSHCTEDSGVVTSKPWPSAAQIVTSPHLRFLARLTAARWPSSLTIRPYLRATHCPVRAIVDSQHPPHHRPSCILRAPHPSETHACRSPTTPSRSLPPSALQPRLHGASHHFKRLRASSPRRAPLHAAHAFIQLRIIVCSWAPFSPLPLLLLLLHRPRSTLVFHPPR